MRKETSETCKANESENKLQQQDPTSSEASNRKTATEPKRPTAPMTAEQKNDVMKPRKRQEASRVRSSGLKDELNVQAKNSVLDSMKPVASTERDTRPTVEHTSKSSDFDMLENGSPAQKMSAERRNPELGRCGSSSQLTQRRIESSRNRFSKRRTQSTSSADRPVSRSSLPRTSSATNQEEFDLGRRVLPKKQKDQAPKLRTSQQRSNQIAADLSQELAFLASNFGGLLQEHDDLHFFSEKQMPGSCQWLLEEPAVARFLADPQGSRAVWCKGRPGCGKSVFASSIINHLQGRGSKCAFHFFRFGSECKNELGPMLISLAYQFAELIPQYRTRLKSLFQQGLSVQKSAPRLIWQKLFLTILFKIRLTTPLYVVVDGLDECDSSAMLLRLLSDIKNSKSNLCVMLISRDTSQLSRGFDRLSKAIEVESLSLDGVDEDLRMYVEEEMEGMRGEQAFKDHISERIIAKADSNFLWASLVVKEVLQCHTEKEIEIALQEVPQHLEQLYERMDVALARASRPADLVMARTILMWTVCSRQRLTLEQLRDALRPEYDEILDLRLTISQVCGEFVIVEVTEIVAMVHATARDFLTDNENANFHIPMADSHHKIFLKCLSRLMNSSSKIQMGRVKAQSFLVYAATSWAYHLHRSTSVFDQDSLALLGQFFSGPAVLSWIHLLAMSGQLGVLIHTSKIMVNFLEQVNRLDADRSPLTHRLREKEHLLSWSTDLVKVIGKFGSHLKAKPKSIYKIVPAFCPSSSALHQTFCSKTSPPSLQISGLSSPWWDDCLARFAVRNNNLPTGVVSLNKHFALLTSDGTVHLYNSRTLDEVRQFKHGERVLAWCFNAVGGKLVTYGFLKTIVWNVFSGLRLLVIQNPGMASAITLGFRSNDEYAVGCFDDCNVRSVSLSNSEAEWSVLSDVFRSKTDAEQDSPPRCAALNPSCSQLAVGYRGAAIAVWSVDEPRPCLIGRCERQGSTGQLATGTFVDTRVLCWNTVTGHVVGVYNDGCVFKWHPFDNEYQEASASASELSCSADGKILVTSSGDGSIRIWDFQHFVPIYQLSSSGPVTALAIDPHERRVYDIRENYCTLWEPNSVLRQWEVEDKTSDTISNQESSTQFLGCPEVSNDAFDPLTALATSKTTLVYATGNDEGVVTCYSQDGTVLDATPPTFMTVEHVCWSDDGKRMASSDLSRRVLVKSIEEADGGSAVKPVCTIKMEDKIKQLLLSPTGHLLLVSTENCLTIWSIEKEEVVSTRPQASRYHWTNSPSDADQLIGFGYAEIQISMWEGQGTTWQLRIDRRMVDGFSTRNGVHTMFPKPTAHFPTDNGNVDHAVDKVVYTLDGSLALVETSKCSANLAREKQFMLISVDSESLMRALGSSSLVVQPQLLSPELVAHLALPLGFVESDPVQAVRRKSFASNTGGAGPIRRSPFSALRDSTSSSVSSNSCGGNNKNGTASSRTSSSTFLSVGDAAAPTTTTTTTTTKTSTEPVLAFLDRDYWVCTYALGDGGVDGRGRADKIRRHHFLPRDWINMEWLELAVMRPDGTLLCPRNGEVAIIANGLREECPD